MNNINIGSRIKKVRGKHNIGMTGICVGIINPHYHECDIKVKCDSAATIFFGDGNSMNVPAGHISNCTSDLWEIIIPDGHKASEYTFSELMNSLNQEMVTN